MDHAFLSIPTSIVCKRFRTTAAGSGNCFALLDHVRIRSTTAHIQVQYAIVQPLAKFCLIGVLIESRESKRGPTRGAREKEPLVGGNTKTLNDYHPKHVRGKHPRGIDSARADRNRSAFD